ncbi:MAG: hypothetical protein ABT940_01575 [Alphaproteobacteria bacterium]
MIVEDDDFPDLPAGRGTVVQNLERAVVEDHLLRREDGGWAVKGASWDGPHPWIVGKVPWPLPCRKLRQFLFTCAYDRARVPWACRNCHKVRIQPRTMRELVAVQEWIGTLSLPFKCGVELGRRGCPGAYGATLYIDGAEQAEAVRRGLVEGAAARPRIGSDLPVWVRRGCAVFEAHCGPIDQYEFDPLQAEIEPALLERVTVLPPPRGRPPRAATYLYWLHTAHRVGDRTCRDFTGGQRMWPPSPADEMEDLTPARSPFGR